MNQQTVVNLLAARHHEFASLGATGLFLFGSRARGDHRADSDIDLFIDYPTDRVPNLFQLIELELALAAEFGVPVSITTRPSLHPLMRDTIERQAVRVM